MKSSVQRCQDCLIDRHARARCLCVVDSGGAVQIPARPIAKGNSPTTTNIGRKHRVSGAASTTNIFPQLQWLRYWRAVSNAAPVHLLPRRALFPTALAARLAVRQVRIRHELSISSTPGRNPHVQQMPHREHITISLRQLVCPMLHHHCPRPIRGQPHLQCGGEDVQTPGDIEGS